MTPQPWWALVGVVIGFSLGEGARYGRYRWEIHRNRRIVKEELAAVLAQLPQKIEILAKAIAALREGQTLSTKSVHLIASGYAAVLTDLYPHLSTLERNCLHVIYERIRVADETMDAFEDSFLTILKNEHVDQPWEAAIGRLEDHLHSLEVVRELATSYIKGMPVDVFGVGAR